MKASAAGVAQIFGARSLHLFLESQLRVFWVPRLPAPQLFPEQLFSSAASVPPRFKGFGFS
jgi:hypothetical protein